MSINRGVYVAYHKDFDRPLYVGQSKNLKRRFKEHINKTQNLHRGIIYELALLEIKKKGVWASLYKESDYKNKHNRVKDIVRCLSIVYGPKIDFKILSEDIKTEQQWISKLNPMFNKK